MTLRRREDALEAVHKFTASFTESDPSVIATSELSNRLERGERVNLVDVRSDEEQAVSMLPGAISRELFETNELLRLRDGNEAADTLVVPYCTVGYRSGLYCRTLVTEHGLNPGCIRNGEGVLMWTFDGCGLVRPVPAATPRRAPSVGKPAFHAKEKPADALDETIGASSDGAPCAPLVKEVHVYGKPWDIAADGYETVYFTSAVGARKFLASRCRDYLKSKRVWTCILWSFVCLLFYLFFTPACGLMYRCGCQLPPSKWGQVETCNIFEPSPAHRCPWCACEGFACIFVAADAKFWKGVPLFDLLPDGCFLTVITVAVLVLLWRKVDRCYNHLSLPSTSAIKAVIGILWFLVYCFCLGGIFFAFTPDYPYWFGISRDLPLTMSAEVSIGDSPICPGSADVISPIFVSSSWVKTRVDSEEVLLLDARVGSDDVFARGAIVADWRKFAVGSSGPTYSVLKSQSELKASFASLGVSPARSVVVYGDWADGWGFDARTYWTLKFLGHPNVFLLVGGIQTYLAEFPEERSEQATTAQAVPLDSWEHSVTPLPKAIVRKGEFSFESRAALDPLLVDIRERGEFDGSTYDGSDGIQRAGHATGAVSFPFSDHFDDNKCLMSCENFRDRLSSLGWSPGRQLYAYCTGGVRSAFFWVAAQHCGINEVANFDGSMWEYAADPSLPMTTEATKIRSASEASTATSGRVDQAPSRRRRGGSGRL